jgi:hypothetical protein
MKKLIVLVFAAILLVACSSKENTEQKKEKVDTVKEETKKEDFNPEEFLKEAKKHDLEWYVAESAKLKPEEISELEKYRANQEAKEQEAYQSILEHAKTKESVNDEGQKVIEYTMVNTLGHDASFFQLQWKEGTDENVSQTADNVKDGQEFVLTVDPAFDKTLDDIDLSSLSLTGSQDEEQ